MTLALAVSQLILHMKSADGGGISPGSSTTTETGIQRDSASSATSALVATRSISREIVEDGGDEKSNCFALLEHLSAMCGKLE